MSRYPKTLKEKAADAKVTLRIIKNKGRDMFRLEYYLDGAFKTKLRADESDALADGNRILAMLNNRQPVFHETEDGAVFHYAKTILVGLVPVDIAARDWMHVYRKFNGEVSIHDLVESDAKHQPAVTGKSVSELVEVFLAEKRTETVAPNYKRMRGRLRRFAIGFGARKLHEITPLELKAWMRGFRWGNWTLNNVRAVLVQFFRWAARNNFLPDEVKAAPEKIDKLRANVKREIFTMEQVTKLLAVLEREKSDLLPYAAIGFFAGVRPKEMARLAWSDVRWNFGDIEIVAEKAKTGVRRLAKMPENLKAWLAPF